jgi:hypothetical protein
MEGYTTKEVVEYYADYIKDGKQIGYPYYYMRVD